MFTTLCFLILQACTPTADWGPYLKKHRGGRYADMQEPKESVVLNENDDGKSYHANQSYEVNEKTEHTRM